MRITLYDDCIQYKRDNSNLQTSVTITVYLKGSTKYCFSIKMELPIGDGSIWF